MRGGRARRRARSPAPSPSVSRCSGRCRRRGGIRGGASGHRIRRDAIARPDGEGRAANGHDARADRLPRTEPGDADHAGVVGRGARGEPWLECPRVRKDPAAPERLPAGPRGGEARLRVRHADGATGEAFLWRSRPVGLAGRAGSRRHDVGRGEAPLQRSHGQASAVAERRASRVRSSTLGEQAGRRPLARHRRHHARVTGIWVKPVSYPPLMG